MERRWAPAPPPRPAGRGGTIAAGKGRAGIRGAAPARPSAGRGRRYRGRGPLSRSSAALACAGAAARTAAGARSRAARSATRSPVEDRLQDNFILQDASAYALAVAVLAAPVVTGVDVLGPFSLIFIAALTIYLGSRAPQIGSRAGLTMGLALCAPLGASLPLLGLYATQRMGFDNTMLYNTYVCILGLIAQERLYSEVLATLKPTRFGVTDTTRAISLALAVAFTFAYLFSEGPLKLVTSNIIAWSLALFSIRAFPAPSFPIAAVLLLGLLGYDVAFVFGTDVMTSVVTQTEAPFALRVAKSLAADRPATLLGLGDVVVPGVAIGFLRRFGALASGPYFETAIIAYTAGLLICLAANEFVQNGQPALLYVVPLVLAAAAVTAAMRSELSALFSFDEKTSCEFNAQDDVPELQSGQLLAATADVDDGMFGASVVLLLKHGCSGGSLGVILNRHLGEADRELLAARLDELEAGWLPEEQRRIVRSARALLQGRVRLGGPLGIRDFPFRPTVVLHSDFSRPDARWALPCSLHSSDAWWSYLSEWDPEWDATGATLFLGLSSWQDGQLAGEMRQEMWGWAGCSVDELGQLDDLRGRLLAAGRVRFVEDSVPRC